MMATARTAVQYCMCVLEWWGQGEQQYSTVCVCWNGGDRENSSSVLYVCAACDTTGHCCTAVQQCTVVSQAAHIYRVRINYRRILQNHIFTNTEQKYMVLLPFERGMFAVS